MPATKAVGIASDSSLGEVYITWMGAPRVRAASPWRLVSDDMEVCSAIAQEGRKYRFVSESGKTADFPITVTRSS